MKTTTVSHLLSHSVSYGIVQPGNSTPGGIPIVRAADISDGEFNPSSTLRVAPDIEQRYARTRLKGGELLLTVVGTPGKTAIAPPSIAGWNVARAVAVLDTTGVTTRWLHYCFATPPVQHQIASVLNTTVQATLNLRDIELLRIPDRERWEQQAIAEVLGALDDKIAANRKLVSTLDGLAEALYRQAARDQRRLTDLANFVNGRNFTKEATGTGRVVVRIAELHSGVGDSTVRNEVDNVEDDNLVRSGGILFAWSGSLTLSRWTQPEALINQHIFKVIPKGGVPPWLAYQAVAERLPGFKRIAADKATTMGHIQRRHLETEAAVPSAADVHRLDPLMSSLWDRAIAAEEESQTLAELRDTLLPALMDGTIRVKDAEKQAEEVL